MKICGFNKDFRLGEESNTTNIYGFPCVTPPCDSHIDISFLLSYSAFGNHSIFITKDGKGYAVGSNENGQITGALDPKIYEKEILIEIKDKNNRNYQFVSAVCGNDYSLYLISSDAERTNRLVYSHSISNTLNPLFLNINGHSPKYLFGGSETSASIDAVGQIYIITKTVFTSPEKPIESIALPGGERAVSVACCETFIVALSTSGRLFESSTEKFNFSLVKEIEGKMIVDISGTSKHCLAVSEDGRVFGYGSNSRGKLGFEEGRSKITEFTEITSLSSHKVISASAGLHHSLFITSDGAVLACGNNGNGQLLTRTDVTDEFFYSPIKTVITSGASFCIAGAGISCVFVGCKAPRNAPNRVISEAERIDYLERENLLLNSQIRIQKVEIERLKKQSSKREEKIPRGIEIIDAETIHNLRKIRDIGFGSSGHVIEVAKEEKYALKVMNTSDCSIEKRRQFISEYEKLNMLHHPNIVSVFGIFLSDEETPPSILLEFCPSDLQKAVKSSSMNNIEIAKTIYQIAEAMRYVHSVGLIHRDLKPSNVLIANDGLIKISDFGISKLMSSDDLSSTATSVGTQKFMAPEILREEKYNEKVDVYSFGVLLFFVLSSGGFPKINLVDVGNGKMAKIPSEFTAFSKFLIESCWSFDHRKRPSFEEIVKLLTKNDFSVVELSKKDLKEVLSFVEGHKKKIPKY